MVDESAALNSIGEPELENVIPTGSEAENQLCDGKDASCFSKEVFDGLPSDAVKELLSLGICVRCILRLFGVQGHIYSCLSLSTSMLISILGQPTDLGKDMVDSDFRKCEISFSSKESRPEATLCRLCLGILQFRFNDDRAMLVEKNSSHDLAVLIADTVKQEGHQIDSFSLEVSIPPDILENDCSVWSYVKIKYGDEPWFQEKLHLGSISVKDALKLSLVNSLESLLNCKTSVSSFRIRLTYNQTTTSKKADKFSVDKGSCKRRKTGTDNSVESVKETLVPCTQCLDPIMGEPNLVGERPFSNSLENESSNCCKFLLQKINDPCHFTVYCYRTPVYFGGRYLKYSRNVSQTRWIIDDERMGEASVEEIIGVNIIQACRGDNYKFHAAGREDIDVRMLGSGRPFLVEVQNARQVPSELFVKDIEKTINNLENKLVRVKNLKMVGSHGWDLMREGEAEKQKQYAALVWISRPLKDEDLQSVSLLKDVRILQRTPIRVLHRRSPLDREKIIHWMKIERIAGSSQYFLLHLCTQAGTYIKEFVHGDLGRTHPSVGSILGCRAEIVQLDVTNVKMDCFLT
ncbi:hypothetical protein L6164_024918 [Bauhinia variegata]|uniref:Uncharacterized protein n=1 Tax=Bauhinia variegata TaxID=167791 RepID=A0ACB9LZZ3_BAUVA|nr:hypothetical protein L6164_024918 [Bauhinia variegata]